MPQGITVIANAGDIEGLRAQAAADLAQARLIALAPDAAITEAILSDASVLVLEVEAASQASLDRISLIRASHPGLPIVAALHNADVSLVRALIRQGVADVADLPFRAEELAAQLRDVARPAGTGASAPNVAPMVTIAGSHGGCGATTVLTHLAAELAGKIRSAKGICIADLDLQEGEVVYYLGKQPRVTVSTLLTAGDRLDAELIRSAVTDSGQGFAILAAPETIAPLDQVDDEQLLRMLALVRREFDFVLVDLPSDWTSWALSVAVASSRVVMVVETSVASLRQAKRKLELFESVGIPRSRVDIAVNRVERRLFRTIGVSEVRDVLEHDVLATLNDENGEMRTAQDQGLLLSQAQRHSKFMSDIEALARLLAS